MSFNEFAILIVIFIFIMLLFRVGDKWVKRLKRKTVKTVNWIGFIIGLGGGVLWYYYDNNVYMFITLIGVVTYFLFYGYDTMEEEKQ